MGILKSSARSTCHVGRKSRKKPSFLRFGKSFFQKKVAGGLLFPCEPSKHCLARYFLLSAGPVFSPAREMDGRVTGFLGEAGTGFKGGRRERKKFSVHRVSANKAWSGVGGRPALRQLGAGTPKGWRRKFGHHALRLYNCWLEVMIASDQTYRR